MEDLKKKICVEDLEFRTKTLCYSFRGNNTAHGSNIWGQYEKSLILTKSGRI